MSLHSSGKMLLALYDNGVLRLWNMMTARCTFKKKMGLIDDEESSPKNEDEAEEDEEEDDVLLDDITKKDLSEIDRKPI